MLLTNQHLDKLIAMQTDFVDQGMLPPSHDKPGNNNDDDDGRAIDDEVVKVNVVLARH